MKKTKVRMSISIDSELFEWTKNKAEEETRTVSNYISWLISREKESADSMNKK